jgi:WD40 repeat protein
LFFNTEGGSLSASSLKDEQWATYTRKYGFQSKGIFQDVDHTNINTICRDPTGTMLAVGYDDQTIRVFKYPCFVEHQVFKQYFGHSSHVTKIKFTNSRMISIGGLDRTIIVWKIEGRENFEEKPVKEEDDDGLDDLEDDVDLPMKAVTRKKPKV